MPLIGRTLIVAALLGAFVLSPATAGAQIYVWRDGSGNIVLSDRAKDASAKTYGVAARATGASFRTTKPLSPKAAQYESLIEQHAARHTVSADLVRAVIQAESAFNPRAVSPKGARGLMQLMPATAAELGVSDAFDPAQNIGGGVRYLKQLLDAYDGRVELALAAYNAGPGAVNKYGGTVPPYRETQNYVARISGLVTATGTEPLPQSGARTRVYRSVEIVGGREVVRYTGTPRPGSERVLSAERR